MFKEPTKKIYVGFFLSSEHPEQRTDNFMQKMNVLSDWWHHSSDSTYLHCCIILKDDNGEEKAYHLNWNGPLMEEEKDFQSWGWQLFRSISVAESNWIKCKNHLEVFYKKYAGSDKFYYDNWWTYLPRLVLYHSTGMECIPWKDSTWICSELICEALQCANIKELEGLDKKYVTSHMLSELLKEYPMAGPEDLNVMKLKKLE